jgi:hypothetical protein
MSSEKMAVLDQIIASNVIGWIVSNHFLTVSAKVFVVDSRKY